MCVSSPVSFLKRCLYSSSFPLSAAPKLDVKGRFREILCNSLNEEDRVNSIHALATELINSFADKRGQNKRNCEALALHLRKCPYLFNTSDRIDRVAEVASRVVKNFTSNLSTVIQRTLKYEDVIKREFNLPFDAKFSRCEVLQESDPHNQLQQACVITFSTSTKEWKVCYKPRDMRPEASIFGDQETSVFSMINFHLKKEKERGSLEVLHFLTLEDQAGQFGYVQFVEDNSCTFQSEEQLKELFFNAGVLECACAYAGVSDLHFENIKLVGLSVVVIDGEVCFTPSVFQGESTLLCGEVGLQELIRSQIPKQPLSGGGRFMDLHRIGKQPLENGYQACLGVLEKYPDLLDQIANLPREGKRRFVILKTTELQQLLISPDSDEEFAETVANRLNYEMKKIFNSTVVEKIDMSKLKEALIQDRKNLDIPIFYLDQDANIYIGDVQIGSLKEPDLEKNALRDIQRLKNRIPSFQ